MSAGRIHYIDWLRVFAVLALFPFHAGRVFNAGEPFYAKSALESVPLAYLLGFIDQWHMPLLFLLAGASTFLAMRKRAVPQYAGERSLRLLVPLVFGVFVLVPPQTWLGSHTNGDSTQSFARYLATGMFLDPTNLLGKGDYWGGLSPAHLWFIMFLWIISLVAVPVLLFGRTETGRRVYERIAERLARPAWWPAAAFVVLVGEALPEIGGKNIFVYTAFFLLGYVALHSDEFSRSAVRYRLPALAAGLGIAAVSVALWRVQDGLPDPSFPRTVWTYVEDLGMWLALLGFLGYGQVMLDRPSSTLSYLSEASYPVYILHQTVIVVAGYFVVTVLPWWPVGWPVLILMSLMVTFGLYEVVRRIPATRFLFGMRPARA